MTTRTEARALAENALEGLGLFEVVVQGSPDLFAGRSPVCVITSRGMDLKWVARELVTLPSTITVAIYVRRDADDDGAAEDQLDSLTTAVLLALHATGVFFVGESSADPASGNLRDVDRNGVLYRVERIPLTVLEES